MAMVRIYGYKGEIIAKPFEVNSVDDEPEPIGEEENIINSSASETGEDKDSDSGEQTGN